jgi:uncharacterized metal-binding protein
MDLQTLFYTIGIIAMVLWILIFVIILAAVLSVKREIENFKKGFREKVVSLVKEKNVEIASALGLTVAHFVLDKIKRAKKKSA